MIPVDELSPAEALIHAAVRWAAIEHHAPRTTDGDALRARAEGALRDAARRLLVGTAASDRAAEVEAYAHTIGIAEVESVPWWRHA